MREINAFKRDKGFATQVVYAGSAIILTPNLADRLLLAAGLRSSFEVLKRTKRTFASWRRIHTISAAQNARVGGIL